MIFGEFALDEAEGVRLAHTLKLAAATLRKGRVLTADDIAMLRAAGAASVAGARLASDDLDEDSAAGAVAALLAGAHLTPRAPYTGRCNLHACEAGVLVVEPACISRLNRIHESITVGTLAPYTPVRRGQPVATIKIIPFAVGSGLVDAWRRAVGAAPPLQLAPLRPHRAALILSESPGAGQKLLADTVIVTRQRLESLGSTLAVELRCAHRQAAVLEALTSALGAGCDLVLISGATVTKDRADVVPAAITAAGGRIEHFGMPVEPGNMLMFAKVGSVPVIVLPGCARSARTNGLDWVLHRLLAKLPVEARDLMGMGVGGLLRSPAEEDEGAREDSAKPPQRGTEGPLFQPRIAAVVLAAGRSGRIDGSNALLLECEGMPRVRRAVSAACGSRCSQVMVVTGFEADRVEAALAGCPVSVAHNPAHAEGMSSSLRCGLKAVPRDVDGVVVLLGDMPRITAAHVDRLIDAFDPECPSIVVPEHGGRRGNPVLWPARYFDEIRDVSGDVGARALLLRHAADIAGVTFDSDAIFADVDTSGVLAELNLR